VRRAGVVLSCKCQMHRFECIFCVDQHPRRRYPKRADDDI
jgi:hypothetical protein